jgi:hypothetical protein
MSETVGLFTVSQPTQRRLQWGDGVVLLGIVVVLYLGVALAVHTPLAATLCPRRWRRPQRAVTARRSGPPPGWCWTGGAGWGRVAP